MKGVNISSEEYQLRLETWSREKMSSMKDFLIYYNSLDVKPAMEAVEKHMNLLMKLGIDPLKECFTISGLAFNYLFLKCYTPLAIINRRELFYSLKDSLIGGPSIVFCRHAKVDETVINPYKYTNPRTVKSILGFDANSLYLSVLKKPMPTGFMVMREEMNMYKPKIISSQSFKAICWIKYLEQKRNINFNHALYEGEIRVGSKNLKVDAYHCSNSQKVTVAQFHGCFFHAHNCYRNPVERSSPHPFRDPLTYDDVLKETELNTESIKNDGIELITMWECEWDSLAKSDDTAKAIIQSEMALKSTHQEMTGEQMLEAITSGKIFGIVECDIHVPEELHEKFAEFPPIF